MLKKAGQMTIQALGRSRASRAKKGKWYAGRKLGIAPNRTMRSTGAAKKLQTMGQVVTKSVVPNAGQMISKMQDMSTVRKMATETCSSIMLQTEDLVNADFGIAYSISANPADPGFTPSLAATANQYQQFTCKGLKFTFTPSSSANQAGSVYLAFQPNVQAADPASVDDIKGIAGCLVGPLYGAATVLMVPAQCLQHAFNIQTVDKSKTTVDTPQVSPGKIVLGFSGAGLSFATPVTVGNLSVSYTFDLSTTRVTQGSNALSGVYNFLPTGAATIGHLTYLDPTTSLLTSGYHTMLATNIAHVFRPRIKGARHMVTYRGTTTGAAHPAPVFQTSSDGSTWTTIVAKDTLTATANHCSTYIMPPARFYKFGYGADTQLDAAILRIASLPTPPTGEPLTV